jgi:cell division protein FtsL
MADGPFKEAVTKLGEALVDFSELEVVTFTGDVTAILKSDKKSIDWSKLMESATVDGSKVQLVAATQLKIDGDAYTFQTNANLPRQDELLKIHAATVEASQRGRAAIVDMLKGFIK